MTLALNEIIFFIIYNPDYSTVTDFARFLG